MKTARFQSSKSLGCLKNMEEANDRHNQVKREVDAHKNYGNIDRFLKALEEDGAQDGEQEESDAPSGRGARAECRDCGQNAPLHRPLKVSW